MKTIKMILAVALAAMMLIPVSCKKEPKKDDKTYEISYKAPKGSVNAGNEVTFSDLSIGAKSRTWEFQDATPATSTDAEVKVVFNKAGEKTVKLTVTFEDNSTKTEEIKVKVLQEIKGEITVDKTTKLGCIRIGESVKFSIKDMVGDCDDFTWSFEGGEPATSSEATPTVKFPARVKNAKVSCTIARKADGAYLDLEKTFVVGNYPLSNAIEGFDPLAFEGEYALSGWQTWTEGAQSAPQILSVVEGGANGTAHCMKVDLTKLTAADGSFVDFFNRDCWMVNGKAKAGQKIEFCFWQKADHIGEGTYSLPDITVRTMLQDWMCSAEFRDALPAGDGWKEIFGTDFPGPQDAELMSDWWGPNSTTEGAEWKYCRYEIDVTGDANNLYAYFRAYNGQNTAVYLDEIEFNLIEE